MNQADGAEEVARKLLEVPLPRRWAHSQGVAAKARGLATILGSHADLLEAAAWLHDVGYSPDLVVTDFHPLDGALYLRDAERADDLLCRLVAYHSSAEIEAQERGLSGMLLREFAPPPAELADALTYCDMTTSPGGEPLTVGERVADIGRRYGPGHVVARSMERFSPGLAQMADRIEVRLSEQAPLCTYA